LAEAKRMRVGLTSFLDSESIHANFNINISNFKITKKDRNRMAEIRNLGIKTGSVRRLGKEMVMYREEEQREQAKVQKMKAENVDQYDLKHAVSKCA